MTVNCITYHLDSKQNIIFISDEWKSFADENKAAHLTPEYVLKRPIDDFISCKESLHIYDMLIHQALQENRTISFPFRCDAPDRRRYMTMEISPLDDGVIEFKSCIEKEVQREPILLLDTDCQRSDEFLKICSWCKKIEANNDWLEAESAIEILKLFNQIYLPKLTHCVCPSCINSFSSS